jgi:hypothetical protein
MYLAVFVPGVYWISRFFWEVHEEIASIEDRNLV